MDIDINDAIRVETKEILAMQAEIHGTVEQIIKTALKEENITVDASAVKRALQAITNDQDWYDKAKPLKKWLKLHMELGINLEIMRRRAEHKTT
jgi:hypothetical protein